MHVLGETEEEFSTRLANNLENLILKEGPETVIKIVFTFYHGKSFNDEKEQMYFVLLTLCGGLFQIAAFIAEPVMGAGGVIPPPATYFEKVNYLLISTFTHFEIPPLTFSSLEA